MAKQKQHDSIKAESKAKQTKAEPPIGVGLAQSVPQAAPHVILQRAWAPQPPALRPNEVLDLQSTIGNRAVQQLLARNANPHRRPMLSIQAKLTVGPANDSYEQEADQVAQQVMSQINTSPAAVSD